MFLFDPQVDFPEIVLTEHISVKAAAEFSGYNIQYLRRLLRNGRLAGIKIGQVWLILIDSLETYLRNGQMVRDGRHGPRRAVAETGKLDAR